MTEYHEDDQQEFALLMPFVTTNSNGGPHDDESYVAGYEMGQLDARLAAAAHHGLGCPEVVIQRKNLPQAELIAMRHGMLANEQPMDLTECADSDEVRSEWAHVVFTWGSPL
jgi:hypothetical protein